MQKFKQQLHLHETNDRLFIVTEAITDQIAPLCEIPDLQQIIFDEIDMARDIHHVVVLSSN